MMHNDDSDINGFADAIIAEFASERDVIAGQIDRGNFGLVHSAHDLIHEFILLAPKHVATEARYRAKSAFLIYQNDAFSAAHLAFYEAITGYYAVARILLRNALELVIRGAFWNCLADKSLRENATVIEQTCLSLYGDRNFKKNIIDWFNDVIEKAPEVEDEMTKNSATVLDKVSPIFADPELRRKLVPPTKILIKQLAAWRMFDPVPAAADRAYEIYSHVSGDIHGAPDKTDTGRRLLLTEGGNPFTGILIPEEFKSSCKLIKEVMELSITIEKNVLGVG